ncbi:MAG: hypothetical protein K0Q72_4407 [Armatimonadetes bacterium]|jgi:hypothetical protein|nr:hypothetical protein [Armatimonadota bacterium]
MTRRTSYALLPAAALLAIGSLGRALACSCLPPPPPKEALQKAAAVFVGKVVEIETDEKARTRKVTLAVSRRWKGKPEKRATVRTAMDSATCGYGFQQDKEYLVYTYSQEQKPEQWTNICTRTKPLSAAKEDLNELGAPAPEL